MAKNVQGVIFLRNGNLFETREAALAVLSGDTMLNRLNDGEMALARYGSGNDVKTLAGIMYKTSSGQSITVIDVEGASADVKALRQEINAKLGTGITSSNTATAQLEALSGGTFTPGSSNSGDTSISGAKEYAYDLVGTLDYSGVTTGDGVYVTNVTQTDGVVAATTATLPSVTGQSEAKKVVIAVSEDKGTVSDTKGTISSSAETIVLTDNTDGGVNFEVNIDNDTIVQDEKSKKLKVASAALTQYIGDGKTIEISAADEHNNKTVSTLLTLSSVSPSSTTVKEEYALKNASGETIGSTIKIYKDSSIVSITYITDPDDPHYQNLEYEYIDASGNTQTEYVDMSELVLEAEFASGVTATDHVVHGVVDSTSESFLTVGAGGFKLDGVQDAIDNAIEALDVTDDTAVAGQYVAAIEETDGIVAVKTRANVSEAVLNNYSKGSASGAVASTDTINEAISKIEVRLDGELAALDATVSGETSDGKVNVKVTETDGKITAVDVVGTDIASASALTAEIAARKAVDGQNGDTYAANSGKKYISGATSLNGADIALNDALDALDADVIKGVKVNGTGLTETNNEVNVQISSVAATGTDASPIIVNTDSNGAVTLQILEIDCGEY